MDVAGPTRPLVFLAFKHNEVVNALAVRLKNELVLRGVDAYRAIDDPHPGWDLDEKINKWIARADGVVVLWSQQGSESTAVAKEYVTAKQLKKRICSVKFPDVRPPSDWSGIEYLPLKGVRFGRLGPQFNPLEWSSIVDLVARFANAAQEERRGSPSP